jgi:hypothetical protein
VNTENWEDGKTLDANVDIVAGATVTISPGATITAKSGVSITVHGTLQATAKTNHARITGSGWSGIVVASGGTLALAGVDLNGAGVQAKSGNASAVYDEGTITGASFIVDSGGKLTTNHSSVVQGNESSILGTFSATYLDYTGIGITLNDPAASATIADSKFTSNGGGDFFTVDAGRLLHVEYSIVSGSHCPFHFNALAKYEMDHVATRGNTYGQMFYNADPGPNTITYSSFEDPNFAQTDRNSILTIDHSYIKSKATVGQVSITNAASSPVTAAGPRSAPGPT